MSDAFTDRQAADIRRTIDQAEAQTGVRFSVYVGGGAADRTFARRIHATLGSAAARTVLFVVDPEARVAEIVTGEQIRWLVDDRACGLAIMSMATSFSVGDLTAGICDGINMLRERARRPPLEYERAPD
jgi:uncharacterized membrane protein YgcG